MGRDIMPAAGEAPGSPELAMAHAHKFWTPRQVQGATQTEWDQLWAIGEVRQQALIPP